MGSAINRYGSGLTDRYRQAHTASYDGRSFILRRPPNTWIP